MTDPILNTAVAESTPKKAFVSALAWPGWSRSGKSEAAAMTNLIAYADRYRTVVERAGLVMPLPESFEIVDRLSGGGQTDFGVPSKVHALDHAPLDGDELAHHVALLSASWDVFLDVTDRVTPELKKGPRGGGRDRDAIYAHVIGADSQNYAHQLDVYTPALAQDPLDREALAAHRQAVLDAIPDFTDGHTRKDNGWPLRYVIRRMAWHILDHAWEMEDKSLD